MLSKAGEAKRASEIAGEKETVELAAIKATSESNYGKLEKQNLENALEEGSTVEQKGKNFLITLRNGNKYRVYSSGKVEYYDFKPMETSTPVYGKLDNEGTLYLRATDQGGYRAYTSSGSITSDWNTTLPASKEAVLKVAIEEPIVPTTAYEFFREFKNMTTIENIENLHTEKATSMASMFFDCWKLEKLDCSKFDTKEVTNMNCMFVRCKVVEQLDLSWFDTSNLKGSIGSMFSGCEKIEKLDLSSFDTTKITNMNQMFMGMSSVKNIDISSFNTENVTKMNEMFYACTNLESLDTSRLSIKNCTSVGRMFEQCRSIKELDFSNFNTNKLTNLQNVFNSCTSLEKINLNNIDTSNITNTQNLFFGCSSLKEIDLRNWDTRNVTAYAGMFQGVTAKIKLGPNWNSNITASNTGYAGTSWNI